MGRTDDQHTLPGLEGTEVASVRDETGLRVQALVGWFIDNYPGKLSKRQIGRNAAAAKRLCEEHSNDEIKVAIVGLKALYPHCPPVNQPWDLMTLDSKFTVAFANAGNHPEVKSRSLAREIAEDVRHERRNGRPGDSATR